MSLSWVPHLRRRIANHLVNKTLGDFSMPGTVKMENSLARYKDAGARDDVARKAPYLLMPSSLLPPGHAVSDHVPTTDMPVIVYRDAKTLKLRAYINQCKHRAAPFLRPNPEMTPTPMKGAAFRCPYHGWTYDARSGDLKSVTAESGGVFPCLEKQSIGLDQITVFEKAGCIFIGGQDMISKGLWSIDEVDDNVSPLLLSPDDPNCRLVGFKEWHINANWQLVVETFLEDYHINTLHKRTLAMVTHKPTTIMLTDTVDERSTRICTALNHFDVDAALAADYGDGVDVSVNDPYFDETSMLFNTFPNTTIAIFKRYAIIWTVIPMGDSNNPQTRIRGWSFTHSTSVGSDPVKAERDFRHVVVGIEEDWIMAEDVQLGLKEDTAMTYGRMEGNNYNFMKNVGEVASQL